jgi:hypothetical protein
MAPLSYRRHRFPPEIIQHAIWLYLRFTTAPLIGHEGYPQGCPQLRWSDRPEATVLAAWFRRRHRRPNVRRGISRHDHFGS